MDAHKELKKFGLNVENSIVIGSGILNALNIRESKDIDVVVTDSKYDELKASGQFRIGENHGKEILENEPFEIGPKWVVLGKSWKFEDLIEKSVILGWVRYNSLEFLLEVKKSWLGDPELHDKCVQDIKLIEHYLSGKY